MTILKNTGRPVGTKPPFFLISLRKSKSNFHKKLVRTSDSGDQDEQLNFAGLLSSRDGRKSL